MTNRRIIYLVIRSTDDNGKEVHGAFTTQDLADAYVTNLYITAYQDEWDGMVGNPIEGTSKMKSPDEITIDEIDEYFDQFDHRCWVETRILKGPIDAQISGNC